MVVAAALACSACLTKIGRPLDGERDDCEGEDCELALPADAGAADRGDAPDQPDGEPSPADAVSALDCVARFGDAEGFALCAQGVSTCSFAVRSEIAVSCLEVCQTRAATCVKANDSTPETPCSPDEEAPCDEPKLGQMCECAV